MNRTLIQQAIKDVIVEHNFTPLLSPILDDVTPIEGLPSMWFAPLKLLEKRGRNTGQIDYYIELVLIYPPTNENYENKMITLSTMEDSMLSVLSSLSTADSVVQIDDVVISAVTKPLTKFSDLSMQASATITTYFGI